jgi:hypothetical protein
MNKIEKSDVAGEKSPKCSPKTNALCLFVYSSRNLEPQILKPDRPFPREIMP